MNNGIITTQYCPRFMEKGIQSHPDHIQIHWNVKGIDLAIKHIRSYCNRFWTSVQLKTIYNLFIIFVITVLFALFAILPQIQRLTPGSLTTLPSPAPLSLPVSHSSLVDTSPHVTFATRVYAMDMHCLLESSAAVFELQLCNVHVPIDVNNHTPLL